MNKAILERELQMHPTDALGEFLEETGIALSDVLRLHRSFTSLRRVAGLLAPEASPLEEAIAKRVRALVHTDDVGRTRAYRRLLEPNGPNYVDLVGPERRQAEMLYFSLFPNGGHASIADGLKEIRGERHIVSELIEVSAMGLDETRHVTTPLSGSLAEVPLEVHASYQREEVLSALGYASLDRKPSSFREGVLRVDGADGRDIDVFFVTLRKSEADYSPTTMYADYPISPTLFHWESQSTTSVASRTGQRYLHGDGEKLLFVRHEKSNEYGTAPYVFLGPVDYVSHTGERPIAITWRLRTPMPADFFAEASVAV